MKTQLNLEQFVALKEKDLQKIQGGEIREYIISSLIFF